MIVPALILLLILTVLEAGGIALARCLRIGVTSADGAFTPVGGGFIFALAPIAAVLWQGGVSTPEAVLLGGASLLAALSFADDILRLSPLLRLIVQIVVAAVVLLPIAQADMPVTYILAATAAVGYSNASNFMDGSNGMLASYSAVVLATMLAAGASPAITGSLLIAVAVFAVFNFRRRALVFSGDVGSITMGFYIAIGIIDIMLSQGKLSAAIFVAVFLIDTFCTFLHRLLDGERVMQPHKRHLYQLLIKAGHSPLAVASAYAGIQLCVNVIWLAVPPHWQGVYAIVAATVLLVLYFRMKHKLSV